MMVKSVTGVARTAQSWPEGHGRAYCDTLGGRTIHNFRVPVRACAATSARRQGAAKGESAPSSSPRVPLRAEGLCAAHRRRKGGVWRTPSQSVIASGAKQSRIPPRGRLDCFAALAMTEYEAVAPLCQLAFRIADTPSRSRGTFRPSFASSLLPLVQEGAGKAGCRLAPAVRCAKSTRRKTAQQHTGVANHSAFPARWLDGLCRALPGAEFPLASLTPAKFTDTAPVDATAASARA